LLEEDLEDTESVGLGCEQTRIEQSGLPFTLAAAEPVDERCHRGDSDREQERDGLAALLPDEHTDHEPAHPYDRKEGADPIDRSITRVGHVANTPASEQDGCDDRRSPRSPLGAILSSAVRSQPTTEGRPNGRLRLQARILPGALGASVSLPRASF
jgi:hypothetical protein